MTILLHRSDNLDTVHSEFDIQVTVHRDMFL